jgi:uncharacterized protein YkwD
MYRLCVPDNGERVSAPERRRAAAMAVAAALTPVSVAGATTRAATRTGTPAAATRACRDADEQPGAATAVRLTTAVRCLIGRERAAAGRAPVAPNRRLAVAAKRHAADMVMRRYFAHTSMGGSTLVDRIRRTGYLPRQGPWRVGEILAWTSGAPATPRGIVDAWMASPEHRRVLLDPKLSDVGMGLVLGSPRPQPPSGPALTVDADFGRVG